MSTGRHGRGERLRVGDVGSPDRVVAMMWSQSAEGKSASISRDIELLKESPYERTMFIDGEYKAVRATVFQARANGGETRRGYALTY